MLGGKQANMNQTRKKPTIFLVSDSTVQTYQRSMAPQCGWGQMLIQYMTAGDYRVYHSPDSRFPNAVTYEADTVKIDNRAMAGRGAKNYLAEGRFDDCLQAMHPNDWLLIQFGHNDAYEAKPERFSKPDEFAKLLSEKFIEPARERNVHPVLVTPIAMRDFDENGVCRFAFNAYREAMLELGKKERIQVLDLGRLTAEFNTKLGPEKCKSVYLWIPSGVYPGWSNGRQDNAHLQFGGAFLFAGLLAQALVSLPDFPQTIVKDRATSSIKDTAFFK